MAKRIADFPFSDRSGTQEETSCGPEGTEHVTVRCCCSSFHVMGMGQSNTLMVSMAGGLLTGKKSGPRGRCAPEGNFTIICHSLTHSLSRRTDSPVLPIACPHWARELISYES